MAHLMQPELQSQSSTDPGPARSAEAPVAITPPVRDLAMDRLRGLIMVIMAIDHASLFIAHQHSSESWRGDITVYSSAFPFLTRFTTHLCAPGFFFLMGAGMAMFAASRRARAWSENRIAWFM